MTTARFPHILKAAYEMAVANGSPHTKGDVADNLIQVLNDDFGPENEDMLDEIDAWIDTLDDDELSILIDGEEDEMAELLKKSPYPAETKDMMDSIFDNVI